MTVPAHSCTGLHGLRTPHVTAAELADLFDSAWEDDDVEIDLTEVDAAFGWPAA